jgi:hypothetical protein
MIVYVSMEVSIHHLYSHKAEEIRQRALACLSKEFDIQSDSDIEVLIVEVAGEEDDRNRTKD